MGEDFSFDPAVMYAKVMEAGRDWADKKAAYEFLDDVSKAVLAELTPASVTVKGVGGGLSYAAAERIALSSLGWKAHLEQKAKARHEYLIADVNYKALNMLAEMRRSQEATRRAEARIV